MAAGKAAGREAAMGAAAMAAGMEVAMGAAAMAAAMAGRRRWQRRRGDWRPR